MNRYRLNISGFLFLILFTGFFASTVFFNHTHISEGSILVHSHPFKPDHNGKPLHSHSNSVYFLVFLLNNFIADINGTNTVDSIILPHVSDIFSGIVINYPSGDCNPVFFLRGPPASTV